MAFDRGNDYDNEDSDDDMMMMMMMMMAMDATGSDNKEDVWAISLFSSSYGFPSNFFFF